MHNASNTRRHVVGTSMTTLLVGFDSAWTPTNSGAIIGVLRSDDGGESWEGPFAIVENGKWYAEPMNCLYANGKVYFAINKITLTTPAIFHR